MPAIQISDLNNAKKDVDHIAEVATSKKESATDRKGNRKRTVSGAIKYIENSAASVLGGLGYDVPVPYKAGLLMISANQTVSYEGLTYAPKMVDLPFTTSGTFEADKFRLVAGVNGADLAAPHGSAMVGFRLDDESAVRVSLHQKGQEAWSLYDFGAACDGSKDDTLAWQKALDSGEPQILVPHGRHNVPGNLSISTEGVFLYGSGAQVIVGADLSDGAPWCVVDANNLRVRGLEFETANRAACFRLLPTGGPIENFDFDGNVFKGFFHAVRGFGTPGNPIKNFSFRGNKSFGPIGSNHSHVIVSYGENVSYVGNMVDGAQNSSQLGITDSKKIAIVGNICRNVDGTDSSDASIQLENNENSDAVITGNYCDHDIWVHDSDDVAVSGNSCRRLRTTVTTQGSERVVITGNKAGGATFSSYASPGAVRSSGLFANNLLDPAKHGLQDALNIAGAYVSDLSVVGNKVISAGATRSVGIVRGASMNLVIADNDFTRGGGVALSGSGGMIRGRDNMGWPYSPGEALVRHPGGQVLTAANSTVEYSAVSTNTGEFYDSATYTYTVPFSGFFAVEAAIQINPGDGAIATLSIYVNGTEANRFAGERPGSSGSVSVHGSSVLRLSAGSAITIRALSSPGATISGGNAISYLRIVPLQG